MRLQVTLQDVAGAGGQTRSTAIRIGRITAIAGATRREIERIAAGLSAQGYATTATSHFVVCRQPADPERALILHAFDERTLDEDLASTVGEELGPIVVAANSSAIVSGKVGHSRSTPYQAKRPSCASVAARTG